MPFGVIVVVAGDHDIVIVVEIGHVGTVPGASVVN
jgi:hypothetical protein